MFVEVCGLQRSGTAVCDRYAKGELTVIKQTTLAQLVLHLPAFMGREGLYLSKISLFLCKKLWQITVSTILMAYILLPLRW